jgi:hypothetical protein
MINGANVLVVRLKAGPDDLRSQTIPGHLIGADGAPNQDWGLHMVDINLTLGDLLEVVRRERAAYVAAHPMR